MPSVVDNLDSPMLSCKGILLALGRGSKERLVCEFCWKMGDLLSLLSLTHLNAPDFLAAR